MVYMSELENPKSYRQCKRPSSIATSPPTFWEFLTVTEYDLSCRRIGPQRHLPPTPRNISRTGMGLEYEQGCGVTQHQGVSIYLPHTILSASEMVAHPAT